MADMAAYGGQYLPTDAQIRQQMEELMKVVDLETMSTKQFIAALSTKFGGADLSSKKKFIKANITEIIDTMEKDGSGDDDSGSEDESSEEEEVKPKKRKTGGGGLSAIKEISDELAAFLQSGKHMARTAIVKALWVYIKENDLQNPNDKREILLDAKMKAVFGVDNFTMFSMNKYIGAHVEPYKPVDLTTSSTPKKRKAKADPKEKGAKKKPGMQAPYRLSEKLVAVVGKRVLPRPQVTQALWAYIRENNLQNPHDKREILCDTLLSRVMGGQAKVTMFSMNKYITPHMLEKLDKSAYVHEEIVKGGEKESGTDGSDDEESDDE
mmetsp:Transcript_20612/g.44776  ORF Transcript_20612/g.44776 Transcript_20612/m.44776 type:complete len:324 (+) Transcript_20612:165-1136(+)|eukprot:CAMPEP_0172314600 /NCGR_PEP_ID=MMETSP1058-20130122/22900_1 /TAXON_ID=83371 /ORGANISM="Detonula confervacea, Strain CCMP 353" /LENGTH=323 /DNA_ID=CAMNT_0013028503 /DNA_START=99 /DNA_END=1070 /DNA_ORIENTATION=-